MFEKEIAKIIDELSKDYENNQDKDIETWAIEKIKQIMDVDDDKAKEIFNEITKGIEIYEQNKAKPDSALSEEEKELVEELEEKVITQADEIKKIVDDHIKDQKEDQNG